MRKEYYLMMMFCFCLLFSYGQGTTTITGTVIAADDNIPLPGVSLLVQGTSNGTTTDFDGNYTIDADNNATLIFSYVGFIKQEVVINGRTSIDIALETDNQQLSEVVIVGYGTQERKDLTGAVSTIKSQTVEDIPVASFDQKLAGQVAGVQVSTVTGTPGGASRIKIRGTGSIGAGSDPLVVIDGFPISNSFNQTSNPLNLVNPNDIESISILKDASSTAIYGSRGANGVIIINTKKGKSGKIQFDLNTYTGFQQVPQKGRPDLLNARQFAQFQQEIRQDAAIANGGAASDAVIPDLYQNPERYGEGTDWYDAILRDAPQQSVNFSARGGGENIKASLSMGYFNQEGVIRYTGYERYTIRANMEADLHDKLRVGLSMAPTFSKQVLNDTERDFVDVVGSSQWLNPIIPITDNNGNRTPYVDGPGLYANPNPLNTLEYNASDVQDFRGIASAFAEYDLTDDLNLKYTFTADYSNGKQSQFTPSFLGGTNNPPPIVPSANLNRGDRINTLSELLINYSKDIGENHSLDFIGGFATQRETFNNVFIAGTDFPDDEVQTIGAAGRITDYNEVVQEWALVSYFARVNYDFMSKYLLTATIRSDGSSRFGSEDRYGTFPSLGVAWRVSEESFMKDSFVENFKLRASYGLSGNFNIGNYTYIPTVGTSNYVFGNTVVNGRALNSLGNPNLSWEESNQLDVGLEGDFIKGRLNFTLDYYRRTTNNMLIDTQIPSSSGFSTSTVNAGQILNHGLELAINSDNIIGKFNWSTGFNIAFNKNEVLSLEGDSDFILSGRSGEGNPTHITKVGLPLAQFYGYVLEGVYVDQKDFDNSPKHPSSVVGSIKYRDVNGDGVIEAVNDFAVIGDPNPDFTFGMTNTFNYENFDFSFVIDGQSGGDVLVGANQFLKNIDGIFNVPTDVLNRWRSPENPGDGVTPTTNGARVIYRDVNSSWVEDASFLRFRNITFGYKLPSPLAGGENSFIRQVRIYASVNNAFLFTNYSRANPQVASSSNRGGGSVSLTPGLDFTSYPLARTFILGLNFSF